MTGRSSDDDARIARLDALVDQHEGVDDDVSRRTVAEALYEKAWVIETREGAGDALPVYRDVARRLEDAHDERLRMFRARALSDVAHLEKDSGDLGAARVAAERVLHEYLDQPPEGAEEEVATAAFLMSELHERDGDIESFKVLMERVLEWVDRPESLRELWIAGVANLRLGRIADMRGNTEESIRRFGRVIELLGDLEDERARSIFEDPEDDRGRRTLLGALLLQAHVYYRTERVAQGDARCRQLIEMLGDDPPEDDVEKVEWARQNLDYSKRRPRRRLRPPSSRRRGA